MYGRVRNSPGLYIRMPFSMGPGLCSIRYANFGELSKVEIQLPRKTRIRSRVHRAGPTWGMACGQYRGLRLSSICVFTHERKSPARLGRERTGRVGRRMEDRP
jgi:hypothetical protein